MSDYLDARILAQALCAKMSRDFNLKAVVFSSYDLYQDDWHFRVDAGNQTCHWRLYSKDLVARSLQDLLADFDPHAKQLALAVQNDTRPDEGQNQKRDAAPLPFGMTRTELSP